MPNVFIHKMRRISGGGVPVYTYTGEHLFVDDGEGNWRIKFLTTGTLTFSRLSTALDVFLVGGGAGGGKGWRQGSTSYYHGGAGGAGGYTKSVGSVSAAVGTGYAIVVGDGGEGSTSVNVGGSQGGDTSAFGSTANGGKCFNGNTYTESEVVQRAAGAGGSGGGQGFYKNGTSGTAAEGGTDGNNGGDMSASSSTKRGGYGQRNYPEGYGETSTREFFGLDGDETATLYASGGNGAKSNVWHDPDADANTGNGGCGGGYNAEGSNGGSGIVIIRNHRA